MEREILLFFHKTLANSFLDPVMVFFTQRGWIFYIPILFFIALQALKNQKKAQILYLILSLSIGIFLSDWLTQEIKNIVQRVRPCHTEYFREIVGCTGSFSFPSNHVTIHFTIATILILFLKEPTFSKRLKTALTAYTLSIAILVSISRVYLGVHWPSDVLAGCFWGILLGFVTYKTIVNTNSIKRAFYLFLIVFSLFRIYFILHAPVDISPDEAHYWEWSRRPDVSYYSKGPMIAYLIAFSTWIFGDNPFGVRALAVVFSFLSSILIYKIGKELFSEKAGYIAGILFQLIPLFTVYGVIFTIDSPFIFFWIFSIYLFMKALEGKKAYWVLLGIIIGFGLLTKYTMAFFYLCMFVYLLKYKSVCASESDSLLSKPAPAHSLALALTLSLTLSLIVFSPVIVWNFQHDWVTLKHTAGQANIYEGFKISLKSLSEFIGSQLLVVTPLIFALGFYFIFKPSALNLIKRQWWFIISFSMPVFAFFLLKSIQGKVQANWAMMSYIPFLFTIAYAFERKILKKLIISAIALSCIFTILTYTMPFMNLSAKLDPSSRLKGWKELGIKVSGIKKELEKDGKVVIFSDRYQISSELAFYVEGKPKVYCINLGRRMNQYDVWESINTELLSKEKINGIFVMYGIKNEAPEEVKKAVDKCDGESFSAQKKGVKIRDYTIFKCYNFKGINEKKPETY